MQPVLAVCVEWLERNNARLASPAKNVPMESQDQRSVFENDQSSLSLCALA
jgi:hypothetical protein